MTSNVFRVIGLFALIFGAFSMGSVFAGSDRDTSFMGVVQSLPSGGGFIGDWMVDGKAVHVAATTTIDQEDGTLEVGASVKVEGLARSDGSIDAREIEVERSGSGGSGSDDDADDAAEAEFLGTIEGLPATPGFIGDWTVSGQTVHVSSTTRIEQEHGAIAVGTSVKVEGTKLADGSVDALEIESRSAGGEDHPEPEIKLTGTIEGLPGVASLVGDWTISGKTVHVAATTHLEAEEGPIALGAMVEVEGTARADGSIDASKIEVKTNLAELKGVVESLPSTTGFVGDWKVSGRTVHVSSSTVIEQEHGGIRPGARVEVKGTLRSDGSINATKIETQSGSGGSGSGSEGERASVKGTILSLPSGSTLVGDWMVGSRLVHVTSSTRFNAEHGMFGVGARVKVKGLVVGDGSVVATKVQLKDSN